eukprot:TRINITY_DN71202_c0_g1_i1.p1 TRINITY_DN71202_c0_g1~~TRINITY_DN71202_c0_g1_i1.p1  ORF type:complete len:247 (-),score=39.87 TRINITY_DN71202_c0_g1_i1:120-860(-)
MGSGTFGEAFFSSLSMIWATELGDKTFFIAALMSMQYNSVVVFAGAISALAVMTVLSTMVGHVVPNLIPPKFTNLVAVLLFFFFGFKMLREAYQHVPADEIGDPAELQEAMEAIQKHHGHRQTGDIEDPPENLAQKGRPFTRLSPIFAQAFTLTFLAEWGDRSQLATIALGTAKDPYGVTLGGILGHFCCTGLAVMGGQFLAKKISFKTINYLGGGLFILFAFFTLWHQEMPSWNDPLGVSSVRSS